MLLDLKLLGGIFIGLALLFCYLTGLRALQNSRRLVNFQRRQPYISLARRSFLLGSLLGLMLILLVMFDPAGIPLNFSPGPQKDPVVTPQVLSTQTVSIQKSPTPLAPVTPVFRLSTADLFSGFTATPSIPIPIVAQFRSQVTPQAEAQISRVRFATEMHGNQLIGPSTRFRNPIHRMYIVYSYTRMTPGAQWTVVWYRDGRYLSYETRLWNATESGAGILEFEQDVDHWLPGIYEVQFFVGNHWKATGTFNLSGVPPTFTPSVQSTTITPDAEVKTQ